MAHFPKPPEGSWTEHFPQLGTGAVSFEDSISPQHYERERAAIFRRTWLNVGRVEQLTAGASRLTKHINAVGVDVDVHQDAHGTIRAYLGGTRRRAFTPVRCEVWEGFVFVN